MSISLLFLIYLLLLLLLLLLLSCLVGDVPWNFEKYLVDKKGVPQDKSGAISSPTHMEDAIDKLLSQ